MMDGNLERGFATADEAARTERVLRKNVEAPDLDSGSPVSDDMSDPSESVDENHAEYLRFPTGSKSSRPPDRANQKSEQYDLKVRAEEGSECGG